MEDIQEQSSIEEINDTESTSNNNNLNEEQSNMTEIQMLENNDKFNIIKEANKLYPQITLAQLLSASPSLRKELELGCKPRVEQILCSLTSPNIPLIIGEIEDKYLRILYDTGANVNIITSNGLSKLTNREIYKSEEEQ
ncbi:hypothetical protein BCR32DRAFT_251971, partial [Anaeromyces robustus]